MGDKELLGVLVRAMGLWFMAMGAILPWVWDRHVFFSAMFSLVIGAALLFAAPGVVKLAYKRWKIDLQKMTSDDDE